MMIDLFYAALHGILIGLCPIGFVIVAALFTFKICEVTDAITTIRRALSSVSTDPAILILIVAWGFGNFMEGIAGFGTAVAIPAAILSGFGIEPIKAICLCLIANTLATGFGAVGVAIITLSGITGLDLETLARTASLPLACVSLPIPFILVFVQGGWKQIRRSFLFCALASLGFAVPTLLLPRLTGVELPTILGGLITIVLLVLAAPRSRAACESRVPFGKLLYAALPFLSVILALTLYALALPNSIKSRLTPGAVILVGAIFGGVCLKVTPYGMLRIAWATLIKAKRALITICVILAFAKILEQAGLIRAFAALIVDTFGSGYAFAATLVGAAGSALTGSGTSSCVLFGTLQRDAALDLNLNAYLFAAANILGAGIGKMICPQSIAIGMAAVGLTGCEGKILKRVLPYFLLLALFATTLVGLLSRVTPD